VSERLEFQADGPAVDLDTGWTGIAHDAMVPTNSRLTLAISGCTGAAQPCGGVGYPTVGSFFCVAPVAADAVNMAAGLPGLGRVRIPGRVVPLP
jgi:hypothetical protein